MLPLFISLLMIFASLLCSMDRLRKQVKLCRVTNPVVKIEMGAM